MKEGGFQFASVGFFNGPCLAAVHAMAEDFSTTSYVRLAQSMVAQGKLLFPLKPKLHAAWLNLLLDFEAGVKYIMLHELDCKASQALQEIAWFIMFDRSIAAIWSLVVSPDIVRVNSATDLRLQPSIFPHLHGRGFKWPSDPRLGRTTVVIQFMA